MSRLVCADLAAPTPLPAPYKPGDRVEVLVDLVDGAVQWMAAEVDFVFPRSADTRHEVDDRGLAVAVESEQVSWGIYVILGHARQCSSLVDSQRLLLALNVGMDGSAAHVRPKPEQRRNTP